MGCSSESFTAADAQVKLRFRIGDNTASGHLSSELTTVKEIVERRLHTGSLGAEFLVETHAPDELVVLAPQLSEAQLEWIQDIVTRPGTLEFALLANPRDHQLLIDAANQTAPVGVESETAWIPVKATPDGRPVELRDDGAVVVRETKSEGDVRTEVLVVTLPPNRRVTDELLNSVEASHDGNGAPAIRFAFNSEGADRMGTLTGNALPTKGFKRRLGVILDNELHSAPTINDLIGGVGIISGALTADEIDRIVSCLNSGRLPVSVRFLEVENVSSDE
jgi:SecD/SecF fusion protein